MEIRHLDWHMHDHLLTISIIKSVFLSVHTPSLQHNCYYIHLADWQSGKTDIGNCVITIAPSKSMAKDIEIKNQLHRLANLTITMF